MYERNTPAAQGFHNDERFERGGYPNGYKDSHQYQYGPMLNEMPPPPSATRYEQPDDYPDARPASVPRVREYYLQTHPSYHSPRNTLGDEILTARRSMRGGIYYTKINLFREIYYVDQYIIYTSEFAPSDKIPEDEEQPYYTEFANGLVRQAALDLLRYPYIVTEYGTLSVKVDLDFVS